MHGKTIVSEKWCHVFVSLYIFFLASLVNDPFSYPWLCGWGINKRNLPQKNELMTMMSEEKKIMKTNMQTCTLFETNI
jgi:hypothetical protein